MLIKKRCYKYQCLEIKVNFGYLKIWYIWHLCNVKRRHKIAECSYNIDVVNKKKLYNT